VAKTPLVNKALNAVASWVPGVDGSVRRPPPFSYLLNIEEALSALLERSSAILERLDDIEKRLRRLEARAPSPKRRR